MKTVFLAWQDPTTRSWWPVGRLTKKDGLFEFVYTNGAKKSPRFIPLATFGKLDTVYESETLFPLFSNRLLNENRPEYNEFVEWLNFPESEHDPIAILGRTGGLRATDSLEIFPCPEPLPNGQYHIHFFVRGISHLPHPLVDDQIRSLKPGDRLLLLADFQNPYDDFALALRPEEPALIVGYCPRYFARDAHEVLQGCDVQPIVRVERVNPTAPYQLRLLCSLTACWPAEFVPCSGELFQPLVATAQVGC